MREVVSTNTQREREREGGMERERESARARERERERRGERKRPLSVPTRLVCAGIRFLVLNLGILQARGNARGSEECARLPHENSSGVDSNPTWLYKWACMQELSFPWNHP